MPKSQRRHRIDDRWRARFITCCLALTGYCALFLVTEIGLETIEAFEATRPSNHYSITPIVLPSPFSQGQPHSKLPEEPDEFDPREVEAFYDWRNDMFFRRFDMTGKGAVDYMTARRTYKVWLDDYGTPSVITVADPLFYWIDLNGNGKFEQEFGEMWLDSFEDGPTGNEKPYDNSDRQQAPSQIPSWSAPAP